MDSFLKMVRHGQIDGPRKRTFTPEAWRIALEKYGSGDEVAQRLYTSGLRIHSKLAEIRDLLSKLKLNSLSTNTRALALVAVANHQYEAFDFQLRQASALSTDGVEPRERRVLDLAATQVTLASGQSVQADSALGSMLDGIQIPLKVALQGRRRVSDDSFADVPWNDVRIEVNLGILYDQAEALWEDCVWNGYVVAGQDRKVIAVPLDPEAKRGMHAAVARKLVLGIESMSYAMRAIEQAQSLGLPGRLKEVQSIETIDDTQNIVVSSQAMDPRGQALLHAILVTACPEFLGAILEEPRERLAGLSILQLLDGWMVVSGVASALWEKTSPLLRRPSSSSESSVSDMREYIPFLDKEALSKAIHEAANLPLNGARAIVDFLTFGGSDGQEFWTQPLVGVDDSNKLYPVAGAIVAPPNIRYVAERWMAQLGVDLDSRGPAFENHIRDVLIEAVSTSPLLSTVAKVAPQDYTFRCPDQRFAQIDALFCVGARVFVIEAKCILEPTDAGSSGTHRAAVVGAAAQAKRRVALIEEFKEHFIEDVKRFGWTLPADFRIYPLVAVSTWAHVGVSASNVPVIDELVLQRFFAGKFTRLGLQFADMSVEQEIDEVFYASAEEAEATVALYFEAPPQLQQYTKNLVLTTVPLYAVSDTDWYGETLDFTQRAPEACPRAEGATAL